MSRDYDSVAEGLIGPSSDWTSAYHIGPKCAVKMIERRHPTEWNQAFEKTHDNEHTFEAKRTARFWQWLRDPQFLKTAIQYRQGDLSNAWNNYQHNFNQPLTQPAESAHTLSLLYASTSKPSPGLEIHTVEDADGRPTVRYGRQDLRWRADEVLSHSRKGWASLLTAVNYWGVPKGTTAWIDVKL